MLKSIAHASFMVSDTQRALSFYCDVLGMQIDDARPDLGYEGAWLNIGDNQIHLLELPSIDPVSGRPPHGGRDRHVAFYVEDIDQLQSALENAGVVYSMSRSGRRALFCRDPDSNALEFIEQ